MSHPIPPDAQRLADRLRLLAQEVESAARYGVPIPYCFTIGGHEYGQVGFAATSEQFDAWADYADATVEEYDHDGKHWFAATADVNGLPLQFAVQCESILTEVSA